MTPGYCVHLQTAVNHTKNAGNKVAFVGLALPRRAQHLDTRPQPITLPPAKHGYFVHVYFVFWGLVTAQAGRGLVAPLPGSTGDEQSPWGCPGAGMALAGRTGPVFSRDRPLPLPLMAALNWHCRASTCSSYECGYL